VNKQSKSPACSGVAGLFPWRSWGRRTLQQEKVIWIYELMLLKKDHQRSRECSPVHIKYSTNKIQSIDFIVLIAMAR
jgi:hypothetical protein